ncbi:MAG: EAL domain-containing protein [Candidatus Solibacter usitatus]|nr:EAL domain-containing protein [Candidatus Solibacter usitatus]
MNVFVARQAIVDRQQRLCGYELLFRSGVDSVLSGVNGANGCSATSQVIRNSMISIGLDKISGGKPALINFPREALLNGYANLLPPDGVVIEILESVEPDAEVIAACRDLKRQGYKLAVDDFTGDRTLEPLIALADILKVDFRATSEEERASLVKRYRKGKLKLLAEKVETDLEFQRALQMGYDCFQGYFIGRPATISTKEIPGYKLNYMQILREVHRPEIDMKKVEALLRPEASLTYHLFRYVNSALFGHSQEIRSIRQAMVIMGERDLRRWISVATLPAMAQDKPMELAIQAAVRARFCELLGEQASCPDPDLFLIGMFSLLDAMLDRPMEELLGELGVASSVRRVLLGSAPAGDRPALVLDAVRAYEAAEWEAATASATSLGVSEEVLPSLYAQSTEWVAQIV